MAQKAAERVKTTKVPFVFDPMSAQDRRAIHTALVDIEGIKTESEGDGQMRRVKVLPAKRQFVRSKPSRLSIIPTRFSGHSVYAQLAQ